MAKNTDPRFLGGSIAGPGGPHSVNQHVLDVSNSVLLDATDVALVGPVRDGVLDEAPVLFMVLSGRINKSKDRAQVGFLFGMDGAAALITELVGLAGRAGWGKEFVELVQDRLAAQP